MTSVESVKGYEATYNDAECQEMYESAMGELSAEGKQLQKEVKAGPKTNEDAKNFIKKGEIDLVANYIDNYRGLDSEVAGDLIKKGYKGSVLSHLGRFNCDKKLATILIKNKEGKHVSRYFELFEKAITPNELVKLCLQFDESIALETLGLQII